MPKFIQNRAVVSKKKRDHDVPIVASLQARCAKCEEKLVTLERNRWNLDMRMVTIQPTVLR